jgi:hypothetical protein
MSWKSYSTAQSFTNNSYESLLTWDPIRPDVDLENYRALQIYLSVKVFAVSEH